MFTFTLSVRNYETGILAPIGRVPFDDLSEAEDVAQEYLIKFANHESKPVYRFSDDDDGCANSTVSHKIIDGNGDTWVMCQIWCDCDAYFCHHGPGTVGCPHRKTKGIMNVSNVSRVDSEADFYIKILDRFVGWTISGTTKNADGFFGVIIKSPSKKGERRQSKIVWFLQDEEGNGAGSFSVQDTKS